MIQRVDRYTEVGKKKDTYSDFMTDFTAHPNTEDLARLSNETAVKRSVRNLFMANPGDYLFSPRKGAGIRKLLFELISEHTTQSIKTACEEVLKNYEPRVKLIEADVQPDEINQLYKISLIFYIINNPDPVGMNLIMHRIR